MARHFHLIAQSEQQACKGEPQLRLLKVGELVREEPHLAFRMLRRDFPALAAHQRPHGLPAESGNLPLRRKADNLLYQK